jgi:hypothetical protein
MADLPTRYLGLDLRTLLVASASPLTGTLDGLRRLEAAGPAAMILPSLFEVQLTLEADQVGRLLEAGAGSLSAALALDDYNAGPFCYLALVEKAKATLEIPVIASLNGVTPGAWVEHASLLEDAGAAALELNIYYVSSSPGLAGSEVEWRYLELVRAVRSWGRTGSGCLVSDLCAQPEKQQRPDAHEGGVDARVGPLWGVGRVVEAGGGVEHRPARGGRVGGRQLAPGDAVGDDSGQLAGEVVDVGPDHLPGVGGQPVHTWPTTP